MRTKQRLGLDLKLAAHLPVLSYHFSILQSPKELLPLVPDPVLRSTNGAREAALVALHVYITRFFPRPYHFLQPVQIPSLVVESGPSIHSFTNNHLLDCISTIPTIQTK